MFRDRTWILAGALAAGLLMTISRGPWLAAAIGLALATVPRMMSDWKRGLQWVLLLVLVGGLAWAGLTRYSDPHQPLSALAEDQISVAYRAELYDHYRPFLEARPWVGYGTITWPRVYGMRSVDNAYLQLALSYGLAGLVPFVLMLLLVGGRLLVAALAGKPLLWALLGVEALFVVNMLSVFLGNQLWPLLFVVLGWSEGAIQPAVSVPAKVRIAADSTPRVPVPVT
jgi:O-antigen ligase